MAVMKWDPLRELEEMSDRLDEVMSRPRAGMFVDRAMEGMILADWIPTVDVSETETDYTIHAELPGVDKKDVTVTVEDGVLSIEGERKHEQVDRGRTHHRVERTYGRFVRRFALPAGADERRARAEYANGILRLSFPKAEMPKPRRIEVTAPERSLVTAKGSSQRRGLGGSDRWARVADPVRHAWAKLLHRLPTLSRR